MVDLTDTVVRAQFLYGIALIILLLYYLAFHKKPASKK